MFIFIPTIAFGVLVWGLLFYLVDARLTWSIILGLLSFLIAQGISSWLIGRRVKTMMDGVQGTLLAGQKKLQEKINRWQLRPPGSVKQAQLEVERDQHVFIKQALGQTDVFNKYYRWSPLLKKQINTLKMQLNYQLRNYKEVDSLLPRCLFLEPLSCAMHMARVYQNKEDPKVLEKLFKRYTMRLRYGQGAIIYALYSWIAVQNNDIDLAHKVLLQADSKMENATIKQNIEVLANNRPRQFSNAGLADEWYALNLETPKVKTQRQRGQKAARGF